MRHSKQITPSEFNAWQFARHRLIKDGVFNLEQMKQLQQWLSASQMVTFSIAGDVDDEGWHYLYGEINTTLNMTCQRCLEMLRYDVNEVFKYVLVENEHREKDVENWQQTLLCKDEYIDLAWFIEEEILLSLPMIIKHDSCNISYENAKTTLPCAQQPFLNLKNMIKNKEQP